MQVPLHRPNWTKSLVSASISLGIGRKGKVKMETIEEGILN